MKNNILKLTAFLLILIGSVSCEKETLDIGTYIEVSPEKGRTQINFIDNETLVIIKNNRAHSDKFKYEISGNKIKLTHSSGTVDEIYFHIINNSKFEIGYLYINFPESPVKTMTFEK